MFGFQNWQQVRAAYQQNADKVRAVFEGFYSPGLVSRMCCDLNKEADLTVARHECRQRACHGPCGAFLCGTTGRKILSWEVSDEEHEVCFCGGGL